MDYKEKLEEAKELYKIANADQKYALELLFPELVESKDERIRKNIKIALMSVEEELADFYSTHHTSQEEFIDWLEKQGEQNKIEALRTEYEKSRADTITEMESSWSEKDEKNLIEVISIVQNISSYDKQYDGYINWLKSIRQRYTWKSSKEQSEVDLEKEIDRYCKPIQAWQIQEAPYTSVEKCARYFFELGLKAQKEK